MDLNGPNGDLLLRLMSAATLRARVLAGNLANQNTPGFTRKEVRFEDLLVKELARSSPNLDRVEPQVITDADATIRGDGNTVSPEEEVSAMRENRLMYELYASILGARMNLIESAIHGDR